MLVGERGGVSCGGFPECWALEAGGLDSGIELSDPREAGR